MKLITKSLKQYMPFIAVLLTTACENDKNNSTNSSETSELSAEKLLASKETLTVNSVDTLLNANYESGTVDSAITGLNPTNATAPDAVYIVPQGADGNYSIAHKIVHGDPAYYSDGNYRSESDADKISAARYLPGDERRYEFSVLLKDWTPWNTGDPTNETNIFQLKLTAGEVPLQIRTQRNAMRLRFATANNVPGVDIIPDVRSYVNQWIHFRIDVLWKNDTTGYMKTYIKLPGQSAYFMVDNKTNYRSYYASGSAGQHGYIKWGLYVAPENVTRIAYHDDIRIIKLPIQ
jgi:hypothetical protein